MQTCLMMRRRRRRRRGLAAADVPRDGNDAALPWGSWKLPVRGPRKRAFV